MNISELLIIFLVGMLVIKPEHLPDLAVTLGRLIKWFRTTLMNVKREIQEPFEEISSHEQK